MRNRLGPILLILLLVTPPLLGTLRQFGFVRGQTNLYADPDIVFASPMGLMGSTIYDHSLYEQTLVLDGPIHIDGYEGYALSFDGDNDYVDIQDDARLNLSEELTVMAWVRHIYDSGHQGVLSINDGTTTNRINFIARRGYGSYDVCYWDTENGWIVTGTQLNNDTWYHLAWSVTYNYLELIQHSLGNHSQGLTYDETYYYHGVNLQSGGSDIIGRISVLNSSGDIVLNITSQVIHPNGLDYRSDHDDIVAGNWGQPFPRVVEIFKENGTLIREWNFTSMTDYRCVFPAQVSNDLFYLLFVKADGLGAPDEALISNITLFDNGTWTFHNNFTLDLPVSASSFDLEQGLDYYGGYLYFLTEDYPLSHEGRIYNISVASETVVSTLDVYYDGSKEGCHVSNHSFVIYGQETSLTIQRICQYIKNGQTETYIDGELIDTFSLQALPTSLGHAWIGKTQTNDEYFEGIIDDLRVYNETRTQAQIQADMIESVYYEPFNLEASITDMEASNYVLAEEKYYTFTGVYGHEYSTSLFDTVKLAFYDGLHWINASYDVIDEEWSLDSGSDYARIKEGTITTSEPNITVTFPLLLLDDILDALNVDLYLYSIDTDGNIDDWEIVASNYFNIFSLGLLTSSTGSGTYSHLTGQTHWDWKVGPSATDDQVQVNMTVKNFQHARWKTGQYIEGGVSGKGISYAEYGLYLYDPDNESWVKGLNVRLNMTDWVFAWGSNAVEFTVQWYNGDSYSHETQIYSIKETSDILNTSRYVVDLWVDIENSSSTWGGHVNPIYFDRGNWFGSGTRGSYISQYQGSIFDRDNDPISSKTIDLWIVYFKLYKDSSSGDDDWVITQDTMFNLLNSRKQGIDHPTFLEPIKFEKTGGWGFFEPIRMMLVTVMTPMIDAISKGALQFFDLFVGFLDTIATFFGFPNAFSTFLSWIGSFWTWMITGLTDLITMLTQLFLFWGTMGTRTIGFMVSVLTWWGLMFTHAFDVIGNGLGTLPNLWNVLGGSYWMILLIILYPVWRIMGKHPEKMVDDMKILIDVFSFIFNIFITIGQFVINLIGRIVESVPIIE